MSYILHIESGLKFDIDDKDAASVQAEIKAAGYIIGNVTLRRMMEGQLDSANGFELIQGLSEQEQAETLEALERAKADEANASVVGGVKQGEGDATPVISSDETTVSADTSVVVVEEAPVQAPSEVQVAVADAIAEGTVPSDNVVSLAQQMLKEASTGKTLTPQASIEERKRRHNKREEMVEAARASQFGPILAAVEAGVVPGVFLSYVNPDMRWFQLPVTELADPANLHARTNIYVDLAPIVSGGWGFSLYVNGKSFTKRQKIKEADAQSLVNALNAWLPGALAEAKAAA